MNVSVSLRSIIHSYESKFILVNITRSKYVSVSLRSIIHSYSTSSSTVFGFALPMVSVSLRSIIHSYQQANTETFLILWVKFPSPYGVSFILMDIKNTDIKIQVYIVSVSLRSIIHSYLNRTHKELEKFIQFPSPYGVSFILILILIVIKIYLI